MPEQVTFSEERFLSAAQKRKVLEAWKRFLKSACAKTQFTTDLYDHLSQHCSFIAHFDRHGFHAFYFERITPELFRFFDQFDPALPGWSAEYNTTHWLSEHNTGADLNHAMRETAGPYLDALRQRFEEDRRQGEINAANKILSRYGLTAVPATVATAAMAGHEKRTSSHPPGMPIQPQLFE
jgi:hypothetical protein